MPYKSIEAKRAYDLRWQRDNQKRFRARTNAWRRRRRAVGIETWEQRNRVARNLIAKRHRFKKLYGMTLEQWEEMFDRQGRSCAICRSSHPRSSRGWHVDHDHKTGRVRAILCVSCNLVLGFVEEQERWLLSVVDYVRRFGCEQRL